jgi:amino acid transporter
MHSPPTEPNRPTLHRAMRATEYFTLAFGSMVGVGWMVVIEEWLRAGGPAGAMLAFALVGVLAVPVAVIYGRLAAQLPQAASEIAYAGKVFPPQVSFLAGWSMTFAYLIVCPYEAVSVGRLAAYLFPVLNSGKLYDIGTYPVYLPHLLLGIVTTIVLTIINYRGIRFSARFQNWTTFGLLAIIAVFLPLGWWRGSIDHMQPLFARGDDLRAALLSPLAVLPIVLYFLTGWETVPKCSEEAATDFAPRRFTGVMLLALAVGTSFYVAIVGTVAMLYPWPELREKDFATAIAFEQAFGIEWLVWVLMFGVILSLLKVFNAMFLASTRLLYALGRAGMLGGGLGTVHAHFGTPTVAIALVCVVTLLASLLGRAVLGPIAEVGSLAGAIGWLTTCLAYICGAAGPVTWKGRTLGLFGAVVSVALGIVAMMSFHAGQWIAVAAWIALGLGLWFARPSHGIR